MSMCDILEVRNEVAVLRLLPWASLVVKCLVMKHFFFSAVSTAVPNFLDLEK